MKSRSARRRPSALVAAAAVGCVAFRASAERPYGGADPSSWPAAAPAPTSSLAWHALDEASRAPARQIELAPSSRGRLGTWLVLGPFKSSTNGLKKASSPAPASVPPPSHPLLDAPPALGGVDEAHLAPTLGQTVGLPPDKTHPAPAWTLASSSEGPINVRAALHASDTDLVSYAAGTLHVEAPGRHYLLLGVDDGVRLFVDGRPVFMRDDPRPQRDDDDVVPLDLTAGDHPILLKLHQREGAWSFGIRVVDANLDAPPGAYLALPGTRAADAVQLASKLSWVSVDRGPLANGYAPRVTVRFPEGAPRGVPLPVHVRLARPNAASALMDLDLGEVPRDASGVGELVANLPRLTRSEDLAEVEAGDAGYEVTVAGRAVRASSPVHAGTREAIARADKVLAPLEGNPRPPWLADGSVESVRHLEERLVKLVAHGDGDTDAQRDEARELDDLAKVLERGADPYASRTGPQRRAYRSPIDDSLQEFGLYVPPSYKPDRGRKYPLVVVLHGLNGHPMAMLRYFFGGDDPKKEQDWEDRHLGTFTFEDLDAFVVTPGGHGNAMYRELGEDDVLRVLDWATARYPIDHDRISITGPSMGGIGTAALAFRRPDVFSSAAPLCGYHSYFVRRDVLGRPMRPWERFLAEERSNVEWADNGSRLPLWIVHGKLDLPEANSGVLIDRYEKLNFSLKHEHPNLGHNVWQVTYEDLKGASWLVGKKRNAHPREVSIRTARLRTAEDAWLHVDELAAPDVWGEARAKVRSKTAVDVSTKLVTALRLERDAQLVSSTAPIVVSLDGSRLTVPSDEPLAFHKEDGKWFPGPAQHAGIWKRGNLTGPFRDVFHEPLLFVYGADDPAQTRANEEVARAWAKIRYGVLVDYPVVSDTELLARGEGVATIANERSLFLVGNARSNRVVRALEQDFPIRVEGSDVLVGATRLSGEHLGAAFIRPNPKRPDRYVAVVEGADALATWRSLSLPDLLPDFVVYDDRVAPARGQVLLGAGMVRAAGFFRNDWSLPEKTSDPFGAASRPEAKSEYDATPYLP